MINECQRTVTRLERQGLSMEAQDMRKQLASLLQASETVKKRIK